MDNKRPVYDAIFQSSCPGNVWRARLTGAVAGVGAAVVLRTVADKTVPGVVPFAFIYPASLLATLIGGWQAGLATLAFCSWLTWTFILPRGSIFGVHAHAQIASTIVTSLSIASVIAVAHAFWAAERRTAQAHNRRLAERELLFRELRHRVTNDFSIVISLLHLQLRHSDNPETRTLLEKVIGQVRSISQVHAQIYAIPEAEEVELSRYLSSLLH